MIWKLVIFPDFLGFRPRLQTHNIVTWGRLCAKVLGFTGRKEGFKIIWGFKPSKTRRSMGVKHGVLIHFLVLAESQR